MKKKTISCVFRTPEVTIEVDSKTPVKDYKHLLFTELYNTCSRNCNDSVINEFERKFTMHLTFASAPLKEA